MQRVAVIGLGIMGGGIARNLLKAGFPVTVHNRTREKAQAVLDAGATWAGTPADAARDVDVVITVVGDDAASRAMWLGESGMPGALSAMRTGAIAVECTTISMNWVRELIAAAQARGVLFMDAPMTGSKVAAAAGQLSLLIGADAAALESARPVLQAFTVNLVHFGPPGAGMLFKLINNMIVAVQIAALAEGMAMAERGGLDMDVVLKALTTGPIGSGVVKMKAAAIAKHDHTDTNFALRWMHKDVTYALRAADELGVPMPAAALTRELLRMAMQQGFADQDFAVVAEMVAKTTE
jgi:3-hydroxyisobutyrate dehydrogenase